MNIERYLKRKVEGLESSTSRTSEFVDLDNLPSDPAKRKPISSFHPNQQDEIRRAYLLKGPCQPEGHIFPVTTFGKESKDSRKFQVNWFDHKSGFGSWLEYSVSTDRAYCLYCYLFKEQYGNHLDAFVNEGFNSWNKGVERMRLHQGNINSLHNNYVKKGEDLLRQDQSIRATVEKPTDKQKRHYRLRLLASVSVAKKFLNQGFSFRGHNESKDSNNKGNFKEFLELIGEPCEDSGKVILGNASGNSQMTSPTIQGEIKQCFAQEVLKQIFDELGNDVFALLVDESSDVSKKEQMAVVIRYVDKLGVVKERFIGFVHVSDTSSLCLKSAIDGLFAQHGLSLTKVRGQGYDGASNMRGEFNGLRALILKENVSAFYVHCFAHQLQLVVVAVAHKHTGVSDLYEKVDFLTNVVCASQQKRLEEKRKNMEEEFGTGSGLNQELSLSRAGDTRWSSHYKTLDRLVTLYPSVMEVLEYIEQTAKTIGHSNQADKLQADMKKFDFVFYLHLMRRILDTTKILSRSLQKKEQDLVNAISLIKSTKRQLESLRLHGFNSFIEEVNYFCEKRELEIANLKDPYINPKKPRQKTNITLHHYYVYDCFNTVLDMQIQEFENCFSEETSDLLTCISSLSPCDGFRGFHIPKLLRLADMYPYDFDEKDKDRLHTELEVYIDNLKEDTRFANLNNISSLVQLMVETKKHNNFTLVYRLLKLALVLHVATATVERCFSAMKYIKSDLRNRMGDEHLSESCICFVKKDSLRKVSIDDVMDRFQKMKPRRMQL
ncbi:uncharacterized protein LOC143591512 [Bidens hawaiensis]|uniref:uncharacterized protein LOC143591512 n=1 Tax=Bidens hawaiensis TaxID=980011 RepID=UPI00404A3E4A